MSLDDLTDTPLDTILMLAKGAANADLTPTTTDDVVVLTASYNASPGTVGQSGLPLLTAHRLREPGQDQGPHSRYTNSVIRLDYYAPATPHVRRASRNALLRHTWNSVAWALQMGRHTSVSSGADVLSQAGLRYVRGADVATFADAASTAGDGVYPHWQADVTFAECHPTTGALVDVDGLDDFLRLRTNFYGSSGAPEDGLYEDHQDLPPTS